MICIKMKNILILLLIGMAIVQLSESFKENLHFGKWLQNINDGTSSFHTFEWIVKVSIMECVDACKSTKACEYINFEVRSHTCALIREQHDSENNHNENVGIKPGYIFGNKSEWNINEFTECDECGSYGKCHICDWLGSNESSCRNSGCPIPRIDRFYGNTFSYGSRIRLGCADGYEVFPEIKTCSENGTWVEDQSRMCILSFFNGSYYFLQPLHMSWFNAKSHCEKMSGHLVDIQTEQEQQFLEGWIDNNFTDFYKHKTWTGGNDLVNEGHFLWSDGSAVFEYTNWRGSNPNDRNGRQDCMALLDTLSDHYWNDLFCDNTYQSICEFQ